MDISIRVGIDTGEVECIGSDARGVALHAAARVLARASADGVPVSSTTRDLHEGSGLSLEDAGAHELNASRALVGYIALAPRPG